MNKTMNTQRIEFIATGPGIEILFETLMPDAPFEYIKKGSESLPKF
jgi:hypothetical protein